MKKKKFNLTEENFDSYISALGFQFPKNADELKIFNKLYENYDHKLDGSEISSQSIIRKSKQRISITQVPKKKKTNLYFKRAVLAAKVASELHNEPTFGHVKFQKIMYLCEHACGMSTTQRYTKQSAGPYDNKFMHSIDRELEKQNWFVIKVTGHNKKYVYVPQKNLPKFHNYYKGYFRKYSKDIEGLIDIFRTQKTHFVELIATLYACWIEILETNKKVSNKLLTIKLYNWSSSKKKYEEEEIIEAINWMVENKITP